MHLLFIVSQLVVPILGKVVGFQFDLHSSSVGFIMCLRLHILNN